MSINGVLNIEASQENINPYVPSTVVKSALFAISNGREDFEVFEDYSSCIGMPSNIAVDEADATTKKVVVSALRLIQQHFGHGSESCGCSDGWQSTWHGLIRSIFTDEKMQHLTLPIRDEFLSCFESVIRNRDDFRERFWEEVQYLSNQVLEVESPYRIPRNIAKELFIDVSKKMDARKQVYRRNRHGKPRLGQQIAGKNYCKSIKPHSSVANIKTISDISHNKMVAIFDQTFQLIRSHQTHQEHLDCCFDEWKSIESLLRKEIINRADYRDFTSSLYRETLLCFSRSIIQCERFRNAFRQIIYAWHEAGTTSLHTKILSLLNPEFEGLAKLVMDIFAADKVMKDVMIEGRTIPDMQLTQFSHTVEIPNKTDEEKVFNNGMRIACNDFSAAMNEIQNQLGNAETKNNFSLQVNLLIQQACIYFAHGWHKYTKKCLGKAARLNAAHCCLDRITDYRILYYQALVHYQLQEYDSTDRCLKLIPKDVHRFFTEQNDPSLPYFLANLEELKGMMLSSQGNIPEAQNCLRQALGILKKYGPNPHHIVSYSSFMLEKALFSHIRHRNEIRIDFNLAVTGGKYQQSLSETAELLNQLIEGCQPSDHHLQMTLYASLGQVQLQMQQYEEAELTLKQAIRSADNQQILSMREPNWQVCAFDDQINSYRLLIDTLMLQKRPFEALKYADYAKARVFRRRLLKGPDRPESVSKLRSIASQCKSHVMHCTLSSICENIIYIWHIPPDENQEISVIIWNYDTCERINSDQLASLVIQTPTTAKHNHTIFHQLPILTKKISPMRLVSVITNDVSSEYFSAQADFVALMKEFDKRFFAPVRSVIDSCTENTGQKLNVVIVCDTPLQSFPFNVFLDEENKFVAQHYSICSTPSLRILELLKERRNKYALEKASKSFLIIDFFEKNGAFKDSDAVHKLMKGDRVIGNICSSEEVCKKLINAWDLYVSSHANFRGNSESCASHSGFILFPDTFKPSNNSAGSAPVGMTSDWIRNHLIRLNSVFLNACYTALGNLYHEGVLGLTRSWLEAGAATAIGTLWAVPDISSRAISFKYYEHILAGATPVQALNLSINDYFDGRSSTGEGIGELFEKIWCGGSFSLQGAPS